MQALTTALSEGRSTEAKKQEGILRGTSTYLCYSPGQVQSHKAGQAVGEAGVGVEKADQLQCADSKHGGIGLQQLRHGLRGFGLRAEFCAQAAGSGEQRGCLVQVRD